MGIKKIGKIISSKSALTKKTFRKYRKNATDMWIIVANYWSTVVIEAVTHKWTLISSYIRDIINSELELKIEIDLGVSKSSILHDYNKLAKTQAFLN